MENKITIEIGENKLAKIKVMEEYGIQTKFVTVEEICKMFLSANTLEKTEKETFLESPILPKFDDISTIQYLESENTQVYVLKKEKGNMDMSYFGDKFNNVGFPTLLFKIYISNDSIKQVKVVAIKDPIISSTTQLFKYPFSNVFANTSICLGANNIAGLDVSNTATIFRIPNLVLTLDNNNDAYYNTNNSQLSLRELFGQLENKEFDENLLFPLNFNYTQWN